MSDLYINNITETNLRRLKITQREHYLHYSKEFTSNQIATELIAPSPGKQIMINSMSSITLFEKIPVLKKEDRKDSN